MKEDDELMLRRHRIVQTRLLSINQTPQDCRIEHQSSHQELKVPVGKDLVPSERVPKVPDGASGTSPSTVRFTGGPAPANVPAGMDCTANVPVSMDSNPSSNVPNSTSSPTV